MFNRKYIDSIRVHFLACYVSLPEGTPPKTNMEPKNGALEDDFPLQTGDSSGSMLVYPEGSFTLIFVGDSPAQVPRILADPFSGHSEDGVVQDTRMPRAAQGMEGISPFRAPKSQEFNWRFSSSRRIRVVKKACMKNMLQWK